MIASFSEIRLKSQVKCTLEQSLISELLLLSCMTSARHLLFTRIYFFSYITNDSLVISSSDVLWRHSIEARKPQRENCCSTVNIWIKSQVRSIDIKMSRGNSFIPPQKGTSYWMYPSVMLPQQGKIGKNIERIKIHLTVSQTWGWGLCFRRLLILLQLHCTGIITLPYI